MRDQFTPNQAPKSYKVRPESLRACTTSSAVTVVLLYEFVSTRSLGRWECSIPIRVRGVGDGVPDDVVEENLEDAARIFVYRPGDALDAAATGQTANRGLGDSWRGGRMRWAVQVLPPGRYD
jgi:hypothetical protein